MLVLRRRLRRATSRPATPTQRRRRVPVKIDHALGTTTIPEEPKRIVIVGYTDHEPLLAMGIKPVGAMDWFGQGTYGKWPWERDAWGGKPAAIVSSKSYEIDFEKVAAQRPDLILGVYAGAQEARLREAVADRADRRAGQGRRRTRRRGAT